MGGTWLDGSLEGEDAESGEASPAALRRDLTAETPIDLRHVYT